MRLFPKIGLSKYLQIWECDDHPILLGIWPRASVASHGFPSTVTSMAWTFKSFHLLQLIEEATAWHVFGDIGLVSGPIYTGKPWKPMETHGKPWKTVDFSWIKNWFYSTAFFFPRSSNPGKIGWITAGCSMLLHTHQALEMIRTHPARCVGDNG